MESRTDRMNVPINPNDITLRALLETAPNPNSKLDYITSLSKNIGTNLFVSLTYVPDKWLLLSRAFETYLEASYPLIEEPYEGYAHKFLGDINNEVVPRWSRIEIKSENSSKRRIVLTDNQPKWSNPGIFTFIDSSF